MNESSTTNSDEEVTENLTGEGKHFISKHNVEQQHLAKMSTLRVGLTKLILKRKEHDEDYENKKNYLM